MTGQIMNDYAGGGVAILLGLSGWLLPYRWNLLRLRRGLDRLVSERINLMIPKIMGSILIVIGLIMVIMTLIAGKTE
jgi:hypothetical protein